MEMTMSTFSHTATRHIGAAGGLVAPAAAAVKHWWGSYIAWRVEQAAIVQLQSMSDRDLKDIGLTRSDIARAVRGGVGNHPFSQHY
jgi:uncharacterized protein YjiS (DUF1127 family)